MGTIENYKTRINSTIGGNVKEYVKKEVRTTLDEYLWNSQYGMDVSIYDIDSEQWNENRIAIMTGEMTDIRDEVLVLSKPDVLKMGTLFEWEKQFWVVVKRRARVIKESFYGTAYRCNVDLRWVDKEGNLKTQKAYAKGRGMGSILVENKYSDIPVMAREIDTPITVITQRNLNLEQDMRFLFEGQPYRVTFVDNLSIDGTTILGMYDDRLQDGDDIVNNIATYNKRYEIKLKFGSNIQLRVGEPYEVEYEIYQDGVKTSDMEVILTGNKELIEINKNTIKLLTNNPTTVRVSLKDNELISTSFEVSPGEEPVENNVFIIGSDTIVWGRTERYSLNTKENCVFETKFPSRVKWSVDVKPNYIDITVGDKYSGTIILTAIIDGIPYKKEIRITSTEVVR